MHLTLHASDFSAPYLPPPTRGRARDRVVQLLRVLGTHSSKPFSDTGKCMFGAQAETHTNLPRYILWADF